MNSNIESEHVGFRFIYRRYLSFFVSFIHIGKRIEKKPNIQQLQHDCNIEKQPQDVDTETTLGERITFR